MERLLSAGNDWQEPKSTDDLEREIARLKREVTDAKLATQIERERGANVGRSISRLRKELEPLYTALRMVFGEIESAIGTEEATAATQPGRTSGKWEIWKQKLPGKTAEVIQALLDHGEMTVQQIMAATRSGQDTIYKTTSKLGQLHLINKNGGKFSLRED